MASDLTPEVTQADREAAASFLNVPEVVRQVKAGRRDDHPFVQAFARHRLTATPQETVEAIIERCARVLWKVADDLEYEPRPEFDDHAQFQAGRAHQARQDEMTIRALKPEQLTSTLNEVEND